MVVLRLAAGPGTVAGLWQQGLERCMATVSKRISSYECFINKDKKTWIEVTQPKKVVVRVSKLNNDVDFPNELLFFE